MSGLSKPSLMARLILLSAVRWVRIPEVGSVEGDVNVDVAVAPLHLFRMLRHQRHNPAVLISGGTRRQIVLQSTNAACSSRQADRAQRRQLELDNRLRLAQFDQLVAAVGGRAQAWILINSGDAATAQQYPALNIRVRANPNSAPAAEGAASASTENSGSALAAEPDAAPPGRSRHQHERSVDCSLVSCQCSPADHPVGITEGHLSFWAGVHSPLD